MNPQVKHYHSPDIDLRTYVPVEPDNVSFLLQVMIGPDNSDASESFDIHVCTPRWLLENCVEPLWGRHMLIIPTFSLTAIKDVVETYCSECLGKDWGSITTRLSRIGKWEFEDYKA